MSSAVSPTSGSSSNTDTTASTTTRTTKQTLDQSDFLSLLTVQMTNQDPMNPISDTDQIAQLAQFSSLEAMNSVATQVGKIATEMGYMRADAQLSSAATLLDREVTVTTSDGDITGKVDSVKADSSTVYVSINGTQYAYGLITSVKPASTSK